MGGNPTLYGYVKDPNAIVDFYGLIVVYRAVNPIQESSVNTGTSIQPKDANANYSIQEYVENGKLNTQYISTTKEMDRAEFYAKSNKSTIIAINTDKIEPKKIGLMVKCTPERGQKCSLFHLMVKCTPIIVELPSVYRGCKPLICFQ